MKLKFEYNKEKDIWCLLNKGKSSNNSPTPTRTYSELVSVYGENPDEKSTSLFIDQYFETGNYDVTEYIKKYKKEFEAISSEYQKLA